MSAILKTDGELTATKCPSILVYSNGVLTTLFLKTKAALFLNLCRRLPLNSLLQEAIVAS